MQKKFDPKVFQLGYVALGTPDIERTKQHYLQNLGMTEVARDGDGSVYLSIGYNHHDLVLRPTGQKALLNVGFQLKPHITVGDFARDARETGLRRHDQDRQSARRRRARRGRGAGRPAHPVLQRDRSSRPRLQGNRRHPFRLGHVAIINPDGDKAIAFFKDFLGFVFTDDIAGIANFLTCNREHHVVNLVKAPESRVHHIAFELRDSACHGIASDALRAAGVNLLWGPSRHTAGHNVASYHHDPDKVMIEFYTEMDAFIPELGMSEPRPWHEHFPMKPRSWGATELNAWGAELAFNLATG